jgi:transcriptional regulator with XRE-family HTH domain
MLWDAMKVETQQELAQRCGTSRQTIQRLAWFGWTDSYTLRCALRDNLGIPIDAWDDALPRSGHESGVGT